MVLIVLLMTLLLQGGRKSPEYLLLVLALILPGIGISAFRGTIAYTPSARISGRSPGRRRQGELLDLLASTQLGLQLELAVEGMQVPLATPLRLLLGLAAACVRVSPSPLSGRPVAVDNPRLLRESPRTG